MTDIVERLRDRDAVVLAGLFHAIPAMKEAADEIERLRAQCEARALAMREHAEKIQTAALYAFRNADEEDWKRLDGFLGYSAHGRFWRDVFKEFRHAIGGMNLTSGQGK